MVQKFLFAMLIALVMTGCMEGPDFKKYFPGDETQKVYKSDKDVLMFILDGSGSMLESDSSGKIKITAAKSMLKDISYKLDNTKTNVGLISFSGGCRSSKLLLEPSNNDLKKVISISSNISPSGKTPLAASIKQAGEVLKNIDKKVNIIIISDGVETCGGDPVSEAKQLKSHYGIDATIYVIGYAVDTSTRMQLESLSNAGGGKYYSADDSQALNTIISNITNELDIQSNNWQGDTFKFKINFDSGSSKLKKEDDDEIKKLANYLIKTEYSAEIQGHTDAIGSTQGNQKLSQKRAESVVNKLIEFEVPQDKVYAVGFGELAPIATNETKEGRFENRRVEAHIIKDSKMNIAFINSANSRHQLNVKQADKRSFIGYYKVTDPDRSYNNYHIWVELYGNSHGVYGEYLNNQLLTKNDKNIFAWNFQKQKQHFTIDYTNNNQYPGSAEFQGRISGNTNKFILQGHWGNGQAGKIVLQRISEAELKCMKKNKKLINGLCR
jgi:outer membrane protein OmpA-like peptidoglycan-associated protein